MRLLRELNPDTCISVGRNDGYFSSVPKERPSLDCVWSSTTDILDLRGKRFLKAEQPMELALRK